MKRYIRKKEEVQATPAIRKGGKIYLPTDAIPRSMEPSEEGYKVVNKDGKEKWLPKEVFENEYESDDTFLDRMKIEYAELFEKYVKCCAFIDSKEFRETIKEDYPAFLLFIQRQAMGSYLATLHNRIEYENGTKVKPDTKYNFGDAIQALKFGLAIRRSGWSDKNLVVFKQVPAHITGDIIPKMQSLPQSAKDLISSGKGFIDYTSQCLIYNRHTGIADSWTPSISDVFAEDWVLVME